MRRSGISSFSAPANRPSLGRSLAALIVCTSRAWAGETSSIRPTITRVISAGTDTLSGNTAVGTWQTVTRNWRDDYQKAFGQPPGPLIKVGVMTDTDNTGATVDAWYGDIRLMPKP